ncbi:PQQ-binding-like beta-propeller repeat protein [Terasakiella sp.]|uniref:outer membrane protein assembly factor BamB family protein n=1 Tax=Terasakiella sp. TaxID=2034861 RepID=UPI003AFF8443
MTGSYSRLFAIDVKTGEELWQYDARLPDGIMPCCDVINRGAALYEDMVYFGTLDAKIVALDAKTGKVKWKKKVGDYKAGYSLTATPLIVEGKVVTGVSGGEFGIVGKVEARDAKTGELVWSRPTIEGHMGTLKGKESTMTGVKMQVGRGICGSMAVVRLGWVVPMTRKHANCFSEQGTRHRGILTCVPVITFIPHPVWPSILIRVKSIGTIRPRRTMVGILTV